MEKSGSLDEDDDEDQDRVLGCSEDEDDDNCDDEGWYRFQSSGKIYHDNAKKKIKGKYYMFNEHGQMLYEWINKNAPQKIGSGAQLNAQLDGVEGNAKTASAPDKENYWQVQNECKMSGRVTIHSLLKRAALRTVTASRCTDLAPFG